MKKVMLCTFFFIGVAIGAELRITNASEFSSFANNVNTGTNYSGTTILLDSDLPLAEYVVGPIGINTTCQFLGTFDGQGYIISDLNINSSLEYVGLFGISHRSIIKNLVLDTSCSIMNLSNGYAYVGGLIGFGVCKVENTVNMASVTFSGNTSSSLCNAYISGVAGWLDSYYNYKSIIKNCANYGTITHSGISSDLFIGGIAGFLRLCDYHYIYNCLNYGTIIHNGTTLGSLYLGGIAAHSWHTFIENCVSAGEILPTTTGKYNYIGSIVGYIEQETYINYCYCTDKLSYYNIYGNKIPTRILNTFNYNSTTFKLNESISIGSYTESTLIGALNIVADYFIFRDYSHWLLNKNGKTISFTFNSRRRPIKINNQIILLPNLANGGNSSFGGWYNDNRHTSPFKSHEVITDTNLYSDFKENINYYTISFDTRGGTPVDQITARFGTVVSLPRNSTKPGYIVGFWEDKYGDNLEFSFTMTAHNVTLYAVWACTRIKSVGDFLNFSMAVSAGTNYSGVTVFLDSDVSLSRINKPIGNYTNHFRGTFDGQGYTISDLSINPSAVDYIGLFGYSSGLTVRNAILDSSCSISYSSSSFGIFYIGGIIGNCYASKRGCKIDNIVNMANISFNGNEKGGLLYFGGIAGHLDSLYSWSVYVENCANYGTIKGMRVTSSTYIGGIVGYIQYDKDSYIRRIENCLNFGEIYGGTSSYDFYLGGISGSISSAKIESCVSAGKMYYSQGECIGGVIGHGGSDSQISRCYFTDDVRIKSLYGRKYSTPSIYNTPTSPTSVNSTLIDALNNHVKFYELNEWLLNSKNDTITFKMDGSKGFSLSSQIILFPNFTSEWRSFVGWFSDSEFTNKFYPSSPSITKNTTLYGRWDKYTIMYDANGGRVSINSRNVPYGSTYGVFPDVERAGYTFNGWSTERNGNAFVNSSTIIPASDHILHAKWVANNYTVTFYANGSDNFTNLTREVTFDGTYGSLPNPTKSGYIFDGWITENNEIVTNETKVKIPNNHTLYAQWKEIVIIKEDSSSIRIDIQTHQVEIVFNTKSLTEDEIIAIIDKYTDDAFAIVKYEDTSDGTRVIIRFTDVENAEEFIKNVEATSDSIIKSVIKKINFIFGDNGSYCFSLLHPFLSLIIFIM